MSTETDPRTEAIVEHGVGSWPLLRPWEAAELLAAADAVDPVRAALTRVTALCDRPPVVVPRGPSLPSLALEAVWTLDLRAALLPLGTPKPTEAHIDAQGRRYDFTEIAGDSDYVQLTITKLDGEQISYRVRNKPLPLSAGTDTTTTEAK